MVAGSEAAWSSPRSAAGFFRSRLNTRTAARTAAPAIVVVTARASDESGSFNRRPSTPKDADDEEAELVDASGESSVAFVSTLLDASIGVSGSDGWSVSDINLRVDEEAVILTNQSFAWPLCRFYPLHLNRVSTLMFHYSAVRLTVLCLPNSRKAFRF